MLQRFEFTGTVGGFSQQEIDAGGFLTVKERDDLQLPKVLSEQCTEVSNAVNALLDSLHTTDESQKSKRGVMVREAFVNQMLHGNHANALLKSDFHLIIEQQRGQTGAALHCLLLLDDHSPRFNLEDVPDPTLLENLEKETGRGLMLIRDMAKATVGQIPREDNGKTMIYSWTEPTLVPVPEQALDEVAI